ncbi:major facilitator superfamily domain-containing protein [Aspergillus pseudodeflectus]|uniref:Major facilitator superfamily domain-containing protein n=1 Tax=Aspergillus pseudodeflectus TaxID=176178 RepID=A0ABR4KCH8_9EURO
MPDHDNLPCQQSTPSATVSARSEQYCIKSTREKIFIISLTSLAMIITMIATNIVLPMLPMNLLVTVFSLVQGLTPALMSALSDLQGCRIAWMFTLLLYLVANIGLAMQDSYVALIILRCLQSLGSSCAIPFGFAVAADISSPAERGRYIGPLQGSVMGAFAFGPVIGGLLEPSLGGAALLAYIVVIPETARNIVGNGSMEPEGWWRLPINVAKILRAFTIFAEKDALIRVIFTSLFYSGVTAKWATTGSHFGALYGLSTLSVGFSFLPYGIAGGIGSIISGKLLDLNYHRIQNRRQLLTENDDGHPQSAYSGFPYEVAGLQVAIPFALLASLSLLTYGWIIETDQPLAVALTFQALIGFSGTPLLGVIYTLQIDLYPTQAVGTQGAPDLQEYGVGVVVSLIGLNIIVALPSLGLVYVKGPKWRMAKRLSEKEG